MESQKPDQEPSDESPTEESNEHNSARSSSCSPDVDLHQEGRPRLKKLRTHQTSKVPTKAAAEQNMSPSLTIAPDPAPVEDAESVRSEDCSTPKSKEHLLPVEPKVCPPAPKKRVSKRKRASPPSQSFFVPSDVHALPDCFKAVFD